MKHRRRRHHLQDACTGKIEDPAVAAVATGGMRGDLGLLHPGSVAHHRRCWPRTAMSPAMRVYTPRGSEAALRTLVARRLRAGAAMRRRFRRAPASGHCGSARCRARGRDPGQFRQPDLAAFRSCARRSMPCGRRQRRAQPGLRRRLHADRPVEAASRGCSRTFPGAPSAVYQLTLDRAREIGLPVVERAGVV